MDVREKTSDIGYGFEIAVGLRNACNAGRCVAKFIERPCPFRKELACKDVSLDDWLDVCRDAIDEDMKVI